MIIARQHLSQGYRAESRELSNGSGEFIELMFHVEQCAITGIECRSTPSVGNECIPCQLFDSLLTLYPDLG